VLNEIRKLASTILQQKLSVLGAKPQIDRGPGPTAST